MLAAAALALADGPDDRLVFEPTPEAKDAQKLGAPEVEKAQKLAKAKQFADAASVLEGLSKRLPASVHDCNLALAYLRASALSYSRDAMAVRRFLREARLASQLSQPNTVSIFDFGQSGDGRLFIAMELIRGRTLHEDGTAACMLGPC